jgi:hypothetical protein
MRHEHVLRTKRRACWGVPVPCQHLTQGDFKLGFIDRQALFSTIPSRGHSIAGHRRRGTFPQPEDIASPHIQRRGIEKRHCKEIEETKERLQRAIVDRKPSASRFRGFLRDAARTLASGNFSRGEEAQLSSIPAPPLLDSTRFTPLISSCLTRLPLPDLSATRIIMVSLAILLPRSPSFTSTTPGTSASSSPTC